MKKTVKELRELIQEAQAIYLSVSPIEKHDCQFGLPEVLAVNVDRSSILLALKDSEEDREYYMYTKDQENGFDLYIC